MYSIIFPDKNFVNFLKMAPFLLDPYIMIGLHLAHIEFFAVNRANSEKLRGIFQSPTYLP
jgi:hypothetical protein